MKKTNVMFKLMGILALMLSSLTHATNSTSTTLTVYAAASLTNALDEIGNNYTRDTGQVVKFSYGASSTLARQIEAGAKADIFLSADQEWMNYLQERNLINKATRRSLLGNTLALIAPISSSLQLKIVPNFALSTALGKERLSIADPDTVPAGKYAKAALMKLGVWNDVADKLVRADNVRTALIFVDRAETPLGIVYETDAVIDSKVRIVDRFPVDSYPAIVYPVALTASANAGANKLLSYLNSSTAQAIFRKYGFVILK